jgi:hypothetical protein
MTLNRTISSYTAVIKYPLENTDEYKGWITFQPLYENPPTVNTNGATVNTEGTAFEIMRDLFSLFPELTIDGKGISRLGNLICLNLPTAIQIQDRVQFDNNAAIGGAGASFEAAANAGASDVAGLAMKTLAGVTDVGDLLERMNGPQAGDIGRLLAAVAANKVPGNRFGNTVTNTLQVTTNPNIRAIFRAVSPREHSFNFKFLPRSQSEAQNAELIIKEFKKNLYPETINVKGVPVGYKFPPKFLIRMMYGDLDAEIDAITPDRSFASGTRVRYVGDRLLPCYLTNMSTTFNPQVAAFYASGHFSEIDLTLTFTEARALSYEDIEGGFDDFGRNKYDFEAEINYNNEIGWTDPDGYGVG